MQQKARQHETELKHTVLYVSDSSLFSSWNAGNPRKTYMPHTSTKSHQLNVSVSRRISNTCYVTLYKPDDWSLDKDIHWIF